MSWYEAQDSLCDCQPYRHLYGALSPLFVEGDRGVVPLLPDVLVDISRHRKESSDNQTCCNVHLATDDVYLLIEKSCKQYTPNSIQSTGRFPANIILDEEAGAMLDEQSGVSKSGKDQGLTKTKARSWKNTSLAGINRVGHNDKGGASRFFYCAKASKKERQGSTHPTMKPLKLMEYLCTLTKTPTGGIVLDPFMGSGTTGLAAQNTGREFIGIEMDEEYFRIANARLSANKKLI